MDWEKVEGVEVIKKVKVCTSTSWDQYKEHKVEKASKGWGDKAMMPGKGNNSLLQKVNGWDLIPCTHTTPYINEKEGWNLINDPNMPNKMSPIYKKIMKGRAGVNPYTKTNKINKPSNCYSEKIQLLKSKLK